MYEQKAGILFGKRGTWVVSTLHGGKPLAGDTMRDILHSAYALASQCNYSEN